MSQDQAFCPACGAPARPGAQFCSTCGKPISIALRCPKCGSAFTPGASFCGACGASLNPPLAAPSPALRPPVAHAHAEPARLPTSPPQPRRPGRRFLPLALGAGALLVVCLIVGALAFRFVSQVPTAVAPPTFQGTTFDAQAYQSLEKSVAKIETAARAGDAEAVANLTHPAVRSTFQPIFQAHRTELKRMADLLATRKLVDMTNTVAEYQVTENGKEYFVTFEARGDEWYLSSL